MLPSLAGSSLELAKFDYLNETGPAKAFQWSKLERRSSPDGRDLKIMVEQGLLNSFDKNSASQTETCR